MKRKPFSSPLRKITHYTLHVNAGIYEADTLFGLIWEVISHRFYHLIKDKKWMD
jgi:hypothetical protein